MSAATSTRSCATCVEIGIAMVRDAPRARCRGAGRGGAPRSASSTRWSAPGAGTDDAREFRKKLRAGELDDKEVELTVDRLQRAQLPGFDIPGLPGAQMGMLNLSRHDVGKAFGQRTKTRARPPSPAPAPLIAEESDKLLDQEALVARGDRRWPRQTASSSSTRSTRSPRAPSAPAAAMSAARACSATCCR